MSITIELPYPPSANRYWRNFRGRMVISAEAKAFKEQAGWIARASGGAMLEGSIAMAVDIYRPAKRGDLDNTLKVTIDSLQGIFYANDSQIVEIHARLFDDKKNPRAVVTVQECIVE
jgi:crossover junction endodeoxyribonuclease RusA